MLFQLKRLPGPAAARPRLFGPRLEPLTVRIRGPAPGAPCDPLEIDEAPRHCERLLMSRPRAAESIAECSARLDAGKVVLDCGALPCQPRVVVRLLPRELHSRRPSVRHWDICAHEHLPLPLWAAVKVGRDALRLGRVRMSLLAAGPRDTTPPPGSRRRAGPGGGGARAAQCASDAPRAQGGLARELQVLPPPAASRWREPLGGQVRANVDPLAPDGLREGGRAAPAGPPLPAGRRPPAPRRGAAGTAGRTS